MKFTIKIVEGRESSMSEAKIIEETVQTQPTESACEKEKRDIPGGSPGNFPNPPTTCCVFSRR